MIIDLHNNIRKDLTIIRKRLDKLPLPEGVMICYHDHYEKPTFSVYTSSGNEAKIRNIDGIRFMIDEELLDYYTPAVLKTLVKRINNEI